MGVCSPIGAALPYRSTQDFDSGDLETGSRTCVKCYKRKYMTEFHWANGKKWRSRSCKECVKLADRARRKVGKSTKTKAAVLRLTYGISEDTYADLLAQGDGCCWICSKPLESGHVDHCHTSGEVRGILCAPCNKGLGHFYDDPKALAKAIEYLEKAPLSIKYLTKHKTPEEISAAKSQGAREHVRNNPYAYSNRDMGGGRRLLPETVQDILDMYATGRYTQYEVATHFGVSQCTVSARVRANQ